MSKEGVQSGFVAMAIILCIVFTVWMLVNLRESPREGPIEDVGDEFFLNFVSGTEYTWLEPGQIITEVRDRYANPVGDACYVSIWYPDKTVFVDSELMVEEPTVEDTFAQLISDQGGFFTIPSAFPGQSFVIPSNITYLTRVFARLGIASGGGPNTITGFLSTTPCNATSCLVANSIANHTVVAQRFTQTYLSFYFNVSVTPGDTYYFYGQHTNSIGTTYGRVDSGPGNAYPDGNFYDGVCPWDGVGGANCTTSVSNVDQHMALYASYFGSDNWYYDFTVPAVNGVYEYQAACMVGNQTAIASKSFHVVPQRIRAEVTK